MMKLIFMITLILKTNQCLICHSEVRKDFFESIHYKEGVECVECHGGNEKSLDIKKAHSGSFKGKLNKKETFKICVSCHSSPERMKAYGIPFDQEFLYYTSKHGRAFKRGNDDVAICSDCHGTHKILPPNNPLSSTNRANIPTTCGRCHGNLKLMKKYKITADVVQAYESSVHSKAFKRGNTNAPVCIDCHGTHGAAPQGVGNVNKVCARCHKKTREYFLKSPHGSRWDKRGLLECVECHGNHNIKKSSHQLWKEKCIKCHNRDSKNYKIARDIYTLFAEGEDEILKTKKLIENVKKLPISILDFQRRIEQAKAYLIEAESLSHSVSLNDIESLISKSQSIAKEIQKDIIKKKKLFESRRIFLPLFWFFVLFTIALILYYRR